VKSVAPENQERLITMHSASVLASQNNQSNNISINIIVELQNGA